MILSLFLLILHVINVKAQQTPTYADTQKPENVLVVFNAESDTSRMIKDYYKLKRGIPSENIIFPGLRFPDTTITIDGVSHNVGLAQVTDIIRDSVNHASGTWYATEHAWKYFYQYVAQPIKNYLVSHNWLILFVILSW